MNILLTGSSGFIGRALLGRLQTEPGLRLFEAGRQPVSRAGYTCVGQLQADTDWSQALQNIQVVVHLAGRAHVLQSAGSDTPAAFQQANVDGALNLARQAAAAGVQRFIFISSIGVNGAQTDEHPFTELCIPQPQVAYAMSKYAAEQGLQALTQQTSMQLVIIRPPLVYAAHAPGNFRRLLQLVASGIPLPFARVENRRSMLALENLLDFIRCCIEHPAAANQVFLVADEFAVSTPQLVRYLAEGMGQPAHLFALPATLLRGCTTLLGKRALFEQVCGSLRIDASKGRQLLGWQPPVNPEQALRKAGREFKALQASRAEP